MLGVVFFPTARPGLLAGDPRCGPGAHLPGCSPVEDRLGEVLIATIHFGCALVFILTLAAICFVFARNQDDPANKVIQVACGMIIIFAVIGVVAGELEGVTFGELTPLYLGEVVAVWAFAASWLVESVRAGRELWSRTTPAIS